MSLAALTERLRPLQLWSAVGLPASQSLIEVQFRDDRTSREVTRNQVVLSLAPLCIGIGGLGARGAGDNRAELSFRDRGTGVELGSLQLAEDGSITAGDTTVCCHRVLGGRHRCLPGPLRLWQSWLQRRRRNTGSPFDMSPAALEQLAVFYICPRPVVLVSVEDGEHNNLFPMDLIGPLEHECFVLSLRSTSASVPAMAKSRRAVLVDVSMNDRSLAYSLGRHHRGPALDWSALPCAVERSVEFGLRVPACGLRVRECEIVTHEPRDSHVVFVCKVLSDQARSEAPRLCHTSGIHQAWRRQRGAVPWQAPTL